MIPFRKVTLSPEAEIDMKKYLDQRLRACKQALRTLHETELPKWRRRYEAKPLEETRNSPFQNASNLVVPVVMIYSDTLLAKVTTAITRMSPIWPVQTFGRYKEEVEPFRYGVETFLGTQALDPSILDIQRNYTSFFGEGIRYGFSVLKMPWVTEKEAKIDLSIDGGDDFPEKVIYDGPRLEKLAFNDFFIMPYEKTLDEADFKAQRRRLKRWELEERGFTGVYDKELVEKMLARPDRSGADAVQQQEFSDAKIETGNFDDNSEWDVYECWCIKRIADRRVRIIVSYHLESKSILRARYNVFPDDPFVMCRLAQRDNTLFGYGYCHILGQFQEEISEMHNQRRDAGTVANAKVWRIDPHSPLGQFPDAYEIFPSARVPAAAGEIEPMSHGEPGPGQLEEERQTLELCDRAAGVPQPMQGAGAGGFNKRGVYNTQGTFAVMQEGNTRADFRVSSLRIAHLQVGRKIARQYAVFGNGSTFIDSFGEQAQDIRVGLKAILDQKMHLAVEAATASLNKEIDKQSDIILHNLLMQHWQAITQIKTQLSAPQIPPDVKEYMMKTLHAADQTMMKILRDFNVPEPERLIPDAGKPTQLPAGPGGGAQPQNSGAPAPVQQPGGGGPPGVPPGGAGQVPATVQ